MKKITVFLALLIHTYVAFPQERPIRVMTFNIRFDNPADGVNSWENRRKLVTLSLRNDSPDFIGMQEVLERQLVYLLDNLPGYGSSGVGRDNGKTQGEYTPILYKAERFELLDQGTFWLSPTPADTGSVGWDAALTRICTWARFREKSSGFEFYFLNTHFDHMGHLARAESARLILHFIEINTGNLPVILAGDFNCSPKEEPYKVLSGANSSLNDACLAASVIKNCDEGTFNGFGSENDPQRIDMIFYKGDWQISSYEVKKIKYGDVFISDHWPVVAVVDGQRSRQGGISASLRSAVGVWQLENASVVQTFTFDSIVTRRALFQFPEQDKRYEKILMLYTLKCDSLTPHDIYPCGEWDYTSYTRVYKHDEHGETESFEIGRFITPYGKRLDLGLNGFTWIYDVTDYEPLLHGKVDLQAANGQELLDLRFLFFEGVPPRDVIAVRNIWPEGSYLYKDLADDAELQATSLRLEEDASTFKIRARISGHGHFGPFNCCEWDPKMHTLILDDAQRFDWKVWRDCGMNPLHPQGGTWQFDRAGWCPGTFVDTYDFEITPFVQPGKTITIDYEIQPYDPANGEEGGNYEMAMQLFEYGKPNHYLDLELMDILAPSTRQEYRRMNPVSLNPVVRVRNNGTDTVFSFNINYGLLNVTPVEFEWTGKLGFMESADIILPKPSWEGMSQSSQFAVSINLVNGMQDQMESNNHLISNIEPPVILPGKFILHVKTQGFGRAADNAYRITNENGDVVLERLVFEDDSLYHDLVELEPGAYDFTFTDSNEDGMIRHWWLYQEDPEKVGENGELKILDRDGEQLINLGYDFAEKKTLQFFIGDPR